MGKPTPQCVPSDDCPVVADGDVFYPHEGETVTMFTQMSVGEWQHFEQIRRLGVELNALQGEPDEAEQTLRLLDQHFDDLCDMLATRVVDWDWTDNRGQPLPKPDGTPGPLKRLSSQELKWLINAGQGEMAAQRKNALRPLQTTSLATKSRSRAKTGR